MKNDNDQLSRMLYQLDSGLNELLTYLGEEFNSTNHEKVDVQEPPKNIISVYDANFFDKPRIIIALNNTVERLSKKDIAVIWSFDGLYDYFMAFFEGDEVVKRSNRGFVNDGMQCDSTELALSAEILRDLMDSIVAKPRIDYDILVLKAESILFKLNRILEKYCS